MRCVIVFWKVQEAVQGPCWVENENLIPRFGHLLRSDNLQYILVLNSETKSHDALLGISRNLVFEGGKPLEESSFQTYRERQKLEQMVHKTDG